MICLEQGRRNRKEQAQRPTLLQRKRRNETPRDRCQAQHFRALDLRHTENKSSQRISACLKPQRHVLSGHQSGDAVPQRPSARCNGPRERGGTQHPFRNGARQILQAMTRTLTARGCPSIPQCSKTPHAAGRRGEEGDTQPTGSIPRHHVLSSVRHSNLHPCLSMTILRACEPPRRGCNPGLVQSVTGP